MTNQTIINFAETRDFGQKINATFEFLRIVFKPLMKSLIYLAGPFILITGLFLGKFFGAYLSFISEIAGSGYPEEQGLEFLGDISITVVSMIIFSSLASVMIITVLYEYILLYQEKGSPDIEPGEVWQQVKKDYFMILLATFAYTFIIYFGFILLIIPGVFLMVALSMVFIVQIKERLGFFKACSRTIQLISGKWWSTAGLLFVTYLIQSTMSFIFILPMYGYMIFNIVHQIDPSGEFNLSTSSSQELIYAFTSLIYAFGGYLLYIIPLTALAFQYYNLVERRDATGLMDKIETLGQTKDENPDEEHY